jgi:hypothetical protein
MKQKNLNKFHVIVNLIVAEQITGITNILCISMSYKQWGTDQIEQQN